MLLAREYIIQYQYNANKKQRNPSIKRKEKAGRSTQKTRRRKDHGRRRELKRRIKGLRTKRSQCSLRRRYELWWIKRISRLGNEEWRRGEINWKEQWKWSIIKNKRWWRKFCICMSRLNYFSWINWIKILQSLLS